MKYLWPNNIRKLSIERGWKQAELARKTGYPPQAVARWWHGERELHQSHLKTFSGVFGCSQGDIINMTSTSTEKQAEKTPVKKAYIDPSEAILGLLQAIKGVVLALVSREILKESDLYELFNYHLRDFRAQDQLGAAEVMNQLLGFLRSTPSLSLPQPSKKPPSQFQDQHQ